MHAANLAGHTQDPWYEELGMTAIRYPRLVATLAVPGALGAAAVAAAVVAGGLPGFLLGFTAVLVAIDRLLDLGDLRTVGADRAFARLARERRGRLRRRASPGLTYLADDTGWAAVVPRRRLGVQTIAISSIAGTTDAHKAEAFDHALRPPEWSRGRWTQLYIAAQRGMPLPPVSVYRVGEQHYLRDGHHRASVARALGADCIDAQVVELGRASSEYMSGSDGMPTGSR
jgi:hypothetical protein